MVPSIKIVFENDNFFFPGQTVRGYVEVITGKSLWVKVIKLKALGYAKVIWHSEDLQSKEKIQHSDTEDYYTMKFNLWGNDSGVQLINAGTYQYKFEFVLPNGVPASFESQYGYVRHTCTAILHVERNDYVEYKQREMFSVGSTLDLNENPFAHEPITMHKDKTICCLCCKGGEISFSLNIEHAGVVPGENISVNAECVNESNRETNSTCIKIVQKVKYKAQSTSKTTEKVICSKSHEGTKPGGEDIWFGELLKIPPVPPTGLPGCSLIHIEYFVMFAFNPSGFSTSLSSTSELFIGAVPLRQTFIKFRAESQSQFPPGFPPPPPQPFPIATPSYGFPNPPMGFPVASPSAPTLDINGMPLPLPNNPPPYPQLPAAPYNCPLPRTPYPWAHMYPELAPPTHQECILEPEINLDDDDQHLGNGARRHGRGKAFVPRYVSYYCTM